MIKLATITSKRQITIPVSLFRRLNLQQGDKVIISEDKGKLTLSPALQLVKQLAGSVKIPEKLKAKNAEEVIRTAKETYFTKRT